MWLQAVGGVPAPAGTPPRPRPAEWNVAAGYANSVDLFQSSGGRTYAVQTVGWSRDLTHDAGPSVLHGRFAWGVEVTPVFAQLTPTRMYGMGVAPVVCVGGSVSVRAPTEQATEVPTCANSSSAVSPSVAP